MKEIKAIVQPFMLDKVLTALHGIKGLPGCTVSRVMGYPRSNGGRADERAFEPKERVKLEMVVANEMAGRVIEAIQKHARTGNKGDGKIFVMECVDVFRVRTGERGEAAV